MTLVRNYSLTRLILFDYFIFDLNFFKFKFIKIYISIKKLKENQKILFTFKHKTLNMKSYV